MILLWLEPDLRDILCSLHQSVITHEIWQFIFYLHHKNHIKHLPHNCAVRWAHWAHQSRYILVLIKYLCNVDTGHVCPPVLCLRPLFHVSTFSTPQPQIPTLSTQYLHNIHILSRYYLHNVAMCECYDCEAGVQVSTFSTPQPRPLPGLRLQLPGDCRTMRSPAVTLWLL